MKYAISLGQAHFTLTIAPFYSYDKIDHKKCYDHVKSIVGPMAIIVEVKDHVA